MEGVGGLPALGNGRGPDEFWLLAFPTELLLLPPLLLVVVTVLDLVLLFGL